MKHERKYQAKDEHPLLETIKNKTANGKNTFSVRELMKGTEPGKETETLKMLFRLFADGKITTTENKRDREDMLIIYEEDNDRAMYLERLDFIRTMTEHFFFYISITQKPSLAHFHETTDMIYSDHALFKFAEDTGLDFAECNVLIHSVNGFIRGIHPVCISDMKMPAAEMAGISERLMDMSGILLQQDLIRIHTDPDGISIRAGVSQRTLKLIQNNDIPVLKISKKISSGLYSFRPYSSIKPVCLRYNKNTYKTFEHVCKAVSLSGRNHDAGISILLYGPSGTGKTEFAFQLALKTGSSIMQLDFSRIQSKWVGETEKNLKRAFGEYERIREKSEENVIMLINECDAVMNRRVSVNTSNDVFANHAQAQLLELLEEFRGIVIATTNMYVNIDNAFHRRFLFRCHIGLPDKETRKLLLNDSGIKQYTGNEIFSRICENNWNAAQLKNVMQKIVQTGMSEHTDSEMIAEFLLEEGLLSSRSRLGFIK